MKHRQGWPAFHGVNRGALATAIPEGGLAFRDSAFLAAVIHKQKLHINFFRCRYGLVLEAAPLLGSIILFGGAFTENGSVRQ